MGCHMVLRFCPGKMRVCRLKAAKWRRGAGLGVLVNAECTMGYHMEQNYLVQKVWFEW